ncbi:hypothetical protein N7478_010082 [Penicillium angulare]|uniref:uncharacterized protein n=1 Tax=Penicillium angulare TaxID=116970 RepID=UPI002541679B|nr:uncharacterized protein N7478_010082 [Penicillium angulare]KAJ5267274.1 hypothetical protein N7478_010082 [Penicillium angulare]
MHAQDTLHLLASSMEMIVQVSDKYISGPDSVDELIGLSEVIDGTHKAFSVLNVGACDTAWNRVNQNGLVTFFNQAGDEAECTLNDCLSVGSWCSATDIEVTSTSVSLSYSTKATSPANSPATSSVTSSVTSSATSFC